MAPDLNTMPLSPRSPDLDRPIQIPNGQTSSATPSRRTSRVMGPPPAPAPGTTSNLAPQTQPPLRNPMSSDGVDVPLRHPRPLTAAELYLECEKEQEAVVNRLTRELTALRAQSASVASNASHSSTSTTASLLPIDISDPNPNHQMTGPTHPTPSRRHRSSSSVSGRSIPTPSTSVSAPGSGIAQAGSTASVPIAGQSQASADRAAAAAGGSTLSRQPSVSASGASTPARQSLDITRHHGGPPSATLYTLPHRPSLSRETSHVSTVNPSSSTQAIAATPVPQTNPSPAPQSPSASVNSAMQHYADTAAYRTEMEIVKAENDMLRQRVRALERALRTRRRDSSQSDVTRSELSSRVPSAAGTGGNTAIHASPAAVAAWAGGVGGVAGPRERSESQSTTASSRRGPAVDEEVRVGESAQSAGIGGRG
ncbi:hypothetical protein LTR78_007073 [Recurvomyces mirabilis]|uniref:Uncharacterized protein n=1 Tax=Recurvomyces mirabilis TaxID=574656 RepID=A0AAE1BYU6_9PEZI|nr:hypothetical protein LTR78_007073 [Recurvomyces mirabilis]KAK5150955.1 hypothetical protein LTS14_009759 [Recurvomyces mirabilis]